MNRLTTGGTALFGAAVACAWLLAAPGLVQAEDSQGVRSKRAAAHLVGQPSSNSAAPHDVTLADVFREAMWRLNVFPLASQSGGPATSQMAETATQEQAN